MSKIINLSTKNFERASILKGKDEFYFAIGEQQIPCHLFVAGFLSQNVSRILISDPTINKFVIKFTSNRDKSEYETKIINLLQKLIKGEQFEISQEEIDKMNSEIENIYQLHNLKECSNTLIYHYLSLIEQLGNEELKQQFCSFLFSNGNQNTSNKSETQTKSEIESRIKKFESIEKVIFNIQNEFCQKENSILISKEYLNEEYSKFIDDVASHFFEIDESLIIQMNSFVLNDILSSQKLKIKDEDTLLQILLNRRSNLLQQHENDDENFFIEKVRFEFLSEKGIHSFLSEISFNDLNHEIWSSITKRLILPVDGKIGNERAESKFVEFEYNEQKPLKGILNHLTEKSNGNIQNNKTIEITCSYLCCGTLDTLVDFNDSSNFTHINLNVNPYWLKYDFKSRKIQINSYFIVARDDSSYRRYMKSWAVEISDDGNSWEKIDERNNVSELNGQNSKQIFNVKMTKPFRYIRIISDKNNHQDSNGFTLGNLEFYGNIIE